MTEKETDGLFALLKIYFPNARQLAQPMVKRAWYLMLAPYAYSDVKEATLSALRRKPKFFPDPQEVAALCPPLPEKNERMSRQEIASDREDIARMQRYRQKLRLERQEADRG